MACQTVISIATVLLSLVFLLKIWKIFVILLWRPYALTRYFRKQGVKGPAYSILFGSLLEIKQMERMARDTVLDTNSHDITHRVLPYSHIWSQLYGDTFLYWYGTQPRVCISDPDLAKQILSNKFGFFPKPKTRPSIQTLIGKGLVLVDGVDWVKRRRVLNPAFSMDKLKVMIKRMAACTISMLGEWKTQATETEDGSKVIEMREQFQELTADIIAHTAFGSSFARGREAFSAQRKLQEYSAATNSDVFIPGTQYLPTPSNLQRWKLDRKIKKSIWSIIQSKLQSNPPSDSLECSYGDDLLGLMIEASEVMNKKDVPKLNMHEIIEECKTFFFAGHETTSNLLTWAVFLLSIHNDWQEKLRREVIQECGMEIPDADMLAKLKMVNMVLLEALRLYGPTLELIRETSEDMKLGTLCIPKNTCVSIPVVKIHMSKDYWGDDANQFNPQRFIHGVSRAAKHPNALLAFAVGPRACIGQNFAMLEAKTILALILQRFSLSVSPEYKHAPANNLTLQPQYGLPIIVKPLHL